MNTIRAGAGRTGGNGANIPVWERHCAAIAAIRSDPLRFVDPVLAQRCRTRP
jgi:hypothetical protein